MRIVPAIGIAIAIGIVIAIVLVRVMAILKRETTTNGDSMVLGIQIAVIIRMTGFI